ncbi:MAG TPA: hypothetical protein EYO71_08900 [Rhodospirillales bacterium]|nr:hypothetical protein [Rhodospirillales bacterium]
MISIFYLGIIGYIYRILKTDEKPFIVIHVCHLADVSILSIPPLDLLKIVGQFLFRELEGYYI